MAQEDVEITRRAVEAWNRVDLESSGAHHRIRGLPLASPGSLRIRRLAPRPARRTGANRGASRSAAPDLWL
jgi:hypothetical protein